VTASLSTFATPRVLKALRLRLLANQRLADRLGRGSARPNAPAVYTEAAVPASVTTGEYVTIGPFSEVPQNTMGGGAHWGRDLTAAIKVVSYTPDPAVGYGLVEQIVRELDGLALEVEGYRTGWVVLEVIPDAYVELVAGVPVQHFPMIFRVHVHES
jgi:hypothetical protein